MFQQHCVTKGNFVSVVAVLILNHAETLGACVKNSLLLLRTKPWIKIISQAILVYLNTVRHGMENIIL